MTHNPPDQPPADDGELATGRAVPTKALSQLPADVRALLPTNTQGQPQAELVQALYRHEQIKQGEFRLTEVRELSSEEWDAAMAAHREIYSVTRGLDAFPSFAWGDLRQVRDELLRQLREQTRPDEWMGPLIEYRLVNYSTALKLYHEYVTAQVNRSGGDLKAQVASVFSETYDRSFGYRLIYSMRNAFQHGVRGLVSLHMTARLVEESDMERVMSEAHIHLNKDAFTASRANAAVRQQVREETGDIDLFELGEEAFAEVQATHTRLAPLLHPAAPAAAQLLIRYIEELGGQRPHFHEYIRGFPTKPSMTTLDHAGFDYVARQAGKPVTYEEEGSPTGAMAVLPTYPSPGGAS